MTVKKSHKIEQRLMLFTSFVKLCATTAGLSGFSIQQSICSPCETSRRSRYPHDVFSIRWNFLCRRCYTKAFLSSTWLWDCSRYKLHFCCDSFATFTVNRYMLTCIILTPNQLLSFFSPKLTSNFMIKVDSSLAFSTEGEWSNSKKKFEYATL